MGLWEDLTRPAKKTINKVGDILKDPVGGISDVIENPGDNLDLLLPGLALPAQMIFDQLGNLIPKPKAVNPLKPGEMPSRNDIVKQILGEQLEMVKKRRDQTLGGSGPGFATAPTASTTLFGA